MLPRRKQNNLQNAVLVTTVLHRFMSHTLISHTNAHAVRGGPIPNEVERFRNESLIYEVSKLKDVP